MFRTLERNYGIKSNPYVQNFGKKLWNQAKEGLTGVRLHTTAEDKKPVKSINQGKGAIR